MRPTFLFNDYDLYSILENQKAKNRDIVQNFTTNDIANKQLEDLANEAVEQQKIETIKFLEDDINIDQSETQVDVSQDFMRHIPDRSRPFYINGIKVSYFVPFTGDKELFKCRPNQFTINHPHAVIEENELIFEYRVIDGELGKTKIAFEKDFSSVKQWTQWVNEQVEQYNQSILTNVQPQIAARQQLISQSQQQVNGLGFKIREKKPAAEELIPPSSRAAKPVNTAKKNISSTAKVGADEQKFDVALSFAGEDREYVSVVAHLLREKGISVFYDDFNKAELWGKNLIDHLGKIYAESSRFIVMFISKHYAIKDWPNHERKFAQDRALRMQEDCILPARFDDTEIKGMPGSVGYINLQETSPEELVDLIIQKISS